MKRRFAPIPEWAREKIEQADLERLERLSERLLDAGSIGKRLAD
ncbi:hypothetical protein SIID45300_03181 [Candidatus Magnetaquicoccaceae bacterium FCR-1]|uniref:DUF4351 domain-containing protein n=2 Tax=Candidatus Magnetaquiglobus chichijimensis TaxID=3141448 RepID=A0ABQ0CD49_9PROT